MVKVYLDTSAFIKRYVQEDGTDLIDFVFSKASPGTKLVISIWNLNESMVALDKYRNRKAITEEQLTALVRGMVSEARESWLKGIMTIVPLHPDLLVDSWRHILAQHIYGGDAVQLATFERERCDFLLAADKKFLSVCRKLGIECFDPESKEDAEKVRQRLS